MIRRTQLIYREWDVCVVCMCVVYVRYVCCVYCGVCDVHVDVRGQQPVSSHSPHYFLRQGLSLNKGLTDSAGLAKHQASGIPCFYLPSAEVIGTHHHYVQQYLNMGAGD